MCVVCDILLNVAYLCVVCMYMLGSAGHFAVLNLTCILSEIS